jgi:hypothetical protein
MKRIFIILFCLISLVSKAQVYQEMPQYGYRANRMAFDSTLQIPTTCGVPTLRSNVLKKAAIAFDSCNNKIYRYNPKTLTWSEISGGSGTTPNLQEVLQQGRSETNGAFNITLNETSGDDNYVFKSYNTDKPEIVGQLLIGNSTNAYFRFGDTSYASSGIGAGFVELKPSGLKLVNADGTYYSSTIANPTNYVANYIDTLPKANGVFALSVNGIKANDTGNVIITIPPQIDTANKWVNSVTKLNDSTLQVVKGTTTTDLTITGTSYATKLKTKVWNNSGASIPRGAVVYINGAHSSNLPTIALAKANDETTSAYTYGLVEDTIANNSSGTVIQNGVITNLNLPTSTYTDGQVLYLSPTVAGGYTLIKPLAPYHYVAIGTITRAHPNFGTIQVAIRNGFQLDELSDVKIDLVPADSTLLQFSRVDSLWHDVSVTNAIGTKYLKPTDTASLSSRINLKVNISDTNTMLLPYLRKTDTATLSTRINNKGYAINFGALQTTLAASTPYYFGMTGIAGTTTANIRRVYIPLAGTIKEIYFYIRSSATSSENWTVSLRLNNATNTTIATIGNTSGDKVFSNSNLNVTVAANDYFEIITTTPAWTTAAGNSNFYGTLIIH